MFSRTKIAAALLVSFLVTAGVGCAAGVKAPPASAKALTLNYWRVLDDADAFDEIINEYRKLHPNVTINYRKLRLEEYENELLNALAEDRGPDILAIHNTWVRGYQVKLLPMPKSLKLAFRETQGTIQKTQVWVEKTVPALTVAQVKNAFVEQVAADAVINAATNDPKEGLVPQIYGLPLALDTMVLYYNKDVMNAAGIPVPAQSWQEFQSHVKRLTRYDDQGKLLRPAVGIGTSRNVERSFDILSLLMMQNGVVMTDENGFPTFHKTPERLQSRPTPPQEEALIFYTDFANPAKETFTWDDTQPNSFDAFAAGKTGYFLGYAYHLPRIRSQAPKLNLGITAIPQIDPEFKVNYANYWLEAVSRKTKHPNEAWDFLQFAANANRAKSYLAKTGKPTALRSLVDTQLNEADLAPFVSQVLTAKSWYKGKNIRATEAAFADMIDAVLRGTEPSRALRFAVDAVSQTVR